MADAIVALDAALRASFAAATGGEPTERSLKALGSLGATNRAILALAPLSRLDRVRVLASVCAFYSMTFEFTPQAAADDDDVDEVDENDDGAPF